MNNYDNYLEVLKQFLVAKGDWALKAWQEAEFDSTSKTPGDVTTTIDKGIEKDFSDLIAQKFPDHGFVGEEFPELTREGEYQWQIDPIDGTKYFAAGAGLWTTTAALTHQGKPVLGCIYVPYTKQLFSATLGGGSFMNGKPIRVKEQVDPAASQISWDLADWGKGADTDSYYNKVFVELVNNFYRVRMIGSGTLAYSWTATGMFAAAVDPARHKSKLVDVAAGFIIAAEAGSKVHQLQLPNDYIRTIIGSPVAVDRILELFDSVQS